MILSCELEGQRLLEERGEGTDGGFNDVAFWLEVEVLRERSDEVLVERFAVRVSAASRELSPTLRPHVRTHAVMEEKCGRAIGIVFGRW